MPHSLPQMARVAADEQLKPALAIGLRWLKYGRTFLYRCRSVQAG